MNILGRKKGGEISTRRVHAGLKVVILEISEDDDYSNIVVKSGLRSLTRTSICSSSSSSNYNSSSSTLLIDRGFECFLKSCHLCKKPLSPDEDVYMYRGDQGFCSIECRSRQIMVDETKEMNVKINKRLAPHASSSIDCVGCETCKLLEDLRRRRHHRNNKFKPFIPPAKQQPLLSFS